jgi:serine/threonine protein kinase
MFHDVNESRSSSPSEIEPVIFDPSRLRESTLSPEEKAKSIHQLENIVHHPERYVDKGGAGKVYRLNNGLCIKIMEPRRLSPHAAIFDLGNGPREEAAFLTALASLEISGVRTPRCFGVVSARHLTDSDMIIMEMLDAVNLQHILNKTASFPESFHWERFVDGLSAYFDAMHRAGILHNDVEPRNIMIDHKSGNARVIDFGRSRSRSTYSAAEWNTATRHEIDQFDRAVYTPLEKIFDLSR